MSDHEPKTIQTGASHSWLALSLSPQDEDKSPIDWEDYGRKLGEELRRFGGWLAEVGPESLLVFSHPADAVACGLHYLQVAGRLASRKPETVVVRAAIHHGAANEDGGDKVRPSEDTALLLRALLAFALPRQLLMSSEPWSAAKEGRPGGEPLDSSLVWLSHGTRRIEGMRAAVEVCEVGIPRFSPLAPPPTEMPSGSSEMHILETLTATRRFDPKNLIGCTFDKVYRIDRQLGRGGMGAVYRAEHLKLGGYCAIKIPRPELLRRPGFLERFRHEAALLRSLSHPNIVIVYDVRDEEDTDLGLAYISMEYIEGQSLRQYFKHAARELKVRDVVDILAQIAAGLDAAHRKDVVHRDIKPDNILIEVKERRAKIVDFGMAKSGDVNLTQEVEGGRESYALTPAFASPEQLRGERPTHASDTYSFAATIYYLFCRDHIFNCETTESFCYAHQFQAPIALSKRNARWPVKVGDAIARSLAKKPEDRHASAGALVAEIREALSRYGDVVYEDFMKGPGPTLHAEREPATSGGRGALWVAAAALVAVVGLGGAYVYFQPSQGVPVEAPPAMAPEPELEMTSEPAIVEAPPTEESPTEPPPVEIAMEQEIATPPPTETMPEASVEETAIPTPLPPSPSADQQRLYDELGIAARARRDLVVNDWNRVVPGLNSLPNELSDRVESEVRARLQEVNDYLFRAEAEWKNDAYESATERLRDAQTKLGEIAPFLAASRKWLAARSEVVEAQEKFAALWEEASVEWSVPENVAVAAVKLEAGDDLLAQLDGENCVPHYQEAARVLVLTIEQHRRATALDRAMVRQRREALAAYLRGNASAEEVAALSEKIAGGRAAYLSGDYEQAIRMWGGDQ